MSITLKKAPFTVLERLGSAIVPHITAFLVHAWVVSVFRVTT